MAQRYRDLNDLLRDPRPDPSREFDKAIDRLAQKPLSHRESLDKGESVRTKYGIIESMVREVLGEVDGELIYEENYFFLDYRDDSCPDVLYRLCGTHGTLDKFIAGEYPIDSDDFKNGVRSAVNTKTRQWVDSPMPHISAFVCDGIKYMDESLYKVRLSHREGWRAEATLTRLQSASVLTKDLTTKWPDIFSLCYKIKDPNGKNIRNRNPMSVWRAFDNRPRQ